MGHTMAKRRGRAFTMRIEWKADPTSPAWDEPWRRIDGGSQIQSHNTRKA